MYVGHYEAPAAVTQTILGLFSFSLAIFCCFVLLLVCCRRLAKYNFLYLHFAFDKSCAFHEKKNYIVGSGVAIKVNVMY